MDDTYSADEAAAKLRLNRVTVHRWIRAGRLQAVKLPGSIGYRIRGADIERIRHQQLGSAADKLARVAVACREAADDLFEHSEVLTGPDRERATNLADKLREMNAEAFKESEFYRDWKGFYRNAGHRNGG